MLRRGIKVEPVAFDYEFCTSLLRHHQPYRDFVKADRKVLRKSGSQVRVKKIFVFLDHPYFCDDNLDPVRAILGFNADMH